MEIINNQCKKRMKGLREKAIRPKQSADANVASGKQVQDNAK
jgi:hypothetical protein